MPAVGTQLSRGNLSTKTPGILKPWQEWTLSLLLLAAAGFLFARNWWGQSMMGLVYLLGPVLIIGVCAFKRCSPLNLIPAALLLTYYSEVTMKLVPLLSFVHTPLTYDRVLFYVDRSFGFSPSLAVYHIVSSLHSLYFFYAVYIGLSTALALCFIAQMRQGQVAWKVVTVLLGAVVIGVCCYNLLPACGPDMTMGDNEFSHLSVVAPAAAPELVPVANNFPRNAMPSLHMTWALLVVWLCRNVRLGHGLAVLFALLTAVSTLCLGEHYIVDLIVAFPFSLAVWNLCVGNVPLMHPSRLLTMMSGVCAYFVWILAIRQAPQLFYSSPLVPWAAAIVTVAGTLYLVYRESPPPLVFRLQKEEEQA